MRIAPVCTLRIAVTVVQVLCVLTAWKRHMILWGNATKFKQVTNYLIACRDCMPHDPVGECIQVQAGGQ